MGLGTDCGEVEHKPAGYLLWSAAVAPVGAPVFAKWGSAEAPRVDASNLPSYPFQAQWLLYIPPRLKSKISAA